MQEKVSDKILHPFIIKIQKIRYKRNVPQPNKSHTCQNHLAKIILNGEKLTTFPLRSGRREGSPLTTTVNIITRGLG